MKKLNLSLLKSKTIKFVCGYKQVTLKVDNVLQNSKCVTFLSSGGKLEIDSADFLYYRVSSASQTEFIGDTDGDIDMILYRSSDNVLSPFIGYTLYDTYGFPVELTKELLQEKGYDIDLKEYYFLRDLASNGNKGTFNKGVSW